MVENANGLHLKLKLAEMQTSAARRKVCAYSVLFILPSPNDRKTFSDMIHIKLFDSPRVSARKPSAPVINLIIGRLNPVGK